MSRILIVSSCVHKELSSRQLDKCLSLVGQSDYDVQVEVLEAGAYEIPFVINSWHKKSPFSGYIALGLLLNTNKYHYQYICSHVHYCFTQFALQGIVVGNGIISASSVDDLARSLDSPDPCLCAYPSAWKAVDNLIRLQARIIQGSCQQPPER